MLWIGGVIDGRVLRQEVRACDRGEEQLPPQAIYSTNLKKNDYSAVQSMDNLPAASYIPQGEPPMPAGVFKKKRGRKRKVELVEGVKKPYTGKKRGPKPKAGGARAATDPVTGEPLAVKTEPGFEGQSASAPSGEGGDMYGHLLPKVEINEGEDVKEEEPPVPKTEEELRMDRLLAESLETSNTMCKICEKTFDDKLKLKRHFINCHSEKKYKCQYCEQTFMAKAVRDMHHRNHEHKMGVLTDYFFCEKCGKKFVNKYYLTDHVKTVHQGPVKLTFRCRICLLEFNTRKTRDRHINREHKGKYQCEVCDHKSGSASGLKIHMKSHGPKTDVCRFCGKALANKYSLEAHERIHTGENPYK